jgi:hypothetical protein
MGVGETVDGTALGSSESVGETVVGTALGSSESVGETVVGTAGEIPKTSISFKVFHCKTGLS